MSCRTSCGRSLQILVGLRYISEASREGDLGSLPIPRGRDLRCQHSRRRDVFAASEQSRRREGIHQRTSSTSSPIPPQPSGLLPIPFLRRMHRVPVGIATVLAPVKWPWGALFFRMSVCVDHKCPGRSQPEAGGQLGSCDVRPTKGRPRSPSSVPGSFLSPTMRWALVRDSSREMYRGRSDMKRSCCLLFDRSLSSHQQQRQQHWKVRRLLKVDRRSVQEMISAKPLAFRRLQQMVAALSTKMHHIRIHNKQSSQRG